MDAWAWTGTTHPVIQAELLAALASTHVWGPMLAHSLVTVLVDNEAVKHALIKGSAHPESNQLLLRNFLVQEAVLEASFWFSRVPSSCNPADAFSRNEFPAILADASREEVDLGVLELLALSQVEV